MIRKTNIRHSFIMLPVILLMVVLGLVMMIAGARMIMSKSQGATSSSTAAMDAVNQRSDRDAINPIIRSPAQMPANYSR